MRHFFSLALLCLLTLPSQAQQFLTMYPRLGGAHYEYTKDTATFQVSMKQVMQIMYDDPAALQQFKKARSKSTWAAIMGFAGGVMLAFPVVTAIAGGEPEWALAAGGAALVAGSIPLTLSYKRDAQAAIDKYNKSHSAFNPRAECYFSGIGLKVVIRF